MKTSKVLTDLFSTITEEEREETRLSFAISDRIYACMKEKGLSKKQFAEAMGKRPSVITLWLSGQHNFTIDTLSKISTFFGKPIIDVSHTEEYPMAVEPEGEYGESRSFHITRN